MPLFGMRFVDNARDRIPVPVNSGYPANRQGPHAEYATASTYVLIPAFLGLIHLLATFAG